MEKLSDSIPEQVNDIAIKTAMGIVDFLTTHTPVDTSKALSNWQTSLQIPIPDGWDIPPYVRGSGGSSRAQSAKLAQMEAKYELSEKQPGEKIFISNTVDYIKGLNDGSISRQGSAFFEGSLIIGRQIIKGAKIKI